MTPNVWGLLVEKSTNNERNYKIVYNCFMTVLVLRSRIPRLYLKSSRNKKDLNDVTAAPFLVGFFAAGS